MFHSSPVAKFVVMGGGWADFFLTNKPNDTPVERNRIYDMLPIAIFIRAASSGGTKPLDAPVMCVPISGLEM